MDLSDYEQNILKELERDLDRDDPKLSRRLAGGFSMGKKQIYGAIIFVLGLFILILGISNNLLLLGVIGFIIMLFGAYRGLPTPHRLDR